jgi:hypothetical protein
MDSLVTGMDPQHCLFDQKTNGSEQVLLRFVVLFMSYCNFELTSVSAHRPPFANIVKTLDKLICCPETLRKIASNQVTVLHDIVGR